MKARGQKFSFSNFLVNWGKIQSKLFKNPNFPSLYELRKTSKYTQPRPTFQNPDLELMDELGKLMS